MDKPKYRIIESRSAEGLRHAVNEAIREGYVPRGGVAVAHVNVCGSNDYTWAQAVVLKDCRKNQPKEKQ